MVTSRRKHVIDNCKARTAFGFAVLLALAIIYCIDLLLWFTLDLSMLQSVTSKIGLKPRGNDKARLKSAFITAINGLQVILQLMKGLPTSVGPPGLHAGITGLLFVLDAIKVRR